MNALSSRYAPLYILTSALLMLCAACSADTEPAATPLAGVPLASQDAPARVAQALTDPNGPNYFVVGGAFADVVGADGEPDELVGRLVNAGEGIIQGSSNENGWYVVSASGKSIFLDEEGRPLGEQRDIIMNVPVGFVALGKRRATTGDIQSAWLVGGEQGRVQMVNLDGEPELGITAKIAGVTMFSAGAYSAGAEQWLLGTQGGNLFALDSTLSAVNSNISFGDGAPISAIVGNLDPGASKRWVIASGSKLGYFPAPDPVDLGVDITSAQTDGSDLIVGTQDGRVAIWPFGSISATPTFIDALEGAPVRAIFSNGQEWLVLGEQGKARVVGTDGSLTKGSLTTLGDGSALTSARWAKDRWLIATESSLVLEARDDLTLTVEYPQPLDSGEILAAEPGKDQVIVVGEGGAYAIVSPQAQDITGKKITPGAKTLMAASYNGEVYFVGGVGGDAHLVDSAGEITGQPYSLLDGNTIHTASWNGNFWLVAGAQGYMERVRPDGTSLGPAAKFPGFDVINHARWSGSEWLVGGVGEGGARVQLVGTDGMALSQGVTIPRMQEVLAVEFSGREWLVGGNDGLVQFISSAGIPRDQPAGQPRDVLSGADIHAIDFHDNEFLVAGERGLVRIVQANLLSPRSAAAAAGFETIRSARWTQARGFGQGECLSNEKCYTGSCLGGGQAGGFCCDRACDGACESCFNDDTAQPDGLCSPVPAGEQPVSAGGCSSEDATTCGETGLCDGAGACALHGADVECAAATCSGTTSTPARLCDGAGTCDEATSTSCAPFNGCSEGACLTGCDADEQCEEGMMCEAGACVQMMEPEPVMEPEPEEDASGCCAVVRPRQVPASLPLGMLLGLMLLRRRRREDA